MSNYVLYFIYFISPLHANKLGVKQFDVEMSRVVENPPVQQSRSDNNMKLLLEVFGWCVSGPVCVWIRRWWFSKPKMKQTSVSTMNKSRCSETS